MELGNGDVRDAHRPAAVVQHGPAEAVREAEERSADLPGVCIQASGIDYFGMTPPLYDKAMHTPRT